MQKSTTTMAILATIITMAAGLLGVAVSPGAHAAACSVHIDQSTNPVEIRQHCSSAQSMTQANDINFLTHINPVK